MPAVFKRKRALRRMSKMINKVAGPIMRRAAYKRVKRGIVAPSRNMHSFRRFTNEERHSVTGTTASFSYECLFNTVRGASEFADLYDRYMITCVVMKFRLVNNPSATLSLNNTGGSGSNVNTVAFANSNWYPCMYYCKDYDDSAAETLQQLQERANTKRIILQPNKFYKIVLRPACTVQTYATAFGTGYAPKWKQWIDMAQQNVPHYGLKYVIDCSALDPADTQPFVIERTTQVFFKCKDVR